MAVDESNKVDLLVTDEKRTSVRLVIADHLDWEVDEGAHLLLLQDKIYAYLDIVESGELVEKRPDLKGVPVIIRVDSKYPLSMEARKFYGTVAPVVAEAGVGLELEVIGTNQVMRY